MFSTYDVTQETLVIAKSYVCFCQKTKYSHVYSEFVSFSRCNVFELFVIFQGTDGMLRTNSLLEQHRGKMTQKTKASQIITRHTNPLNKKRQVNLYTKFQVKRSLLCTILFAPLLI